MKNVSSDRHVMPARRINQGRNARTPYYSPGGMFVEAANEMNAARPGAALPPYLRPSISSQNSGAFCSISSSASGNLVRKKKSFSVFLWSTR